MKYVFRDGKMVEKETGLPMLNQAERAKEPQAPKVFGDWEGYQSPIDGSWIDGRRARRYDLEKNNCIDANDLSTPKKLKNQRFIEKHNLQKLAE